MHNSKEVLLIEDWIDEVLKQNNNIIIILRNNLGFIRMSANNICISELSENIS